MPSARWRLRLNSAYSFRFCRTGRQRLPPLEPSLLQGPGSTPGHQVGRLRSRPGPQVQDQSSGRQHPPPHESGPTRCWRLYTGTSNLVPVANN